ncbi:MAG: GNAT family N-acetyltransferase [Ectobacillus sp.]
MIRKLTEQDHEQVMKLLKKEPSLNLFLIGDIEAYGYRQDFQELWGDLTEDGTIQAVLLRFHDSFIPYANGPLPTEEFAKKMKEYEKITLSGKSDIIEQFENIQDLQLGPKRKMYFCECLNADKVSHSEKRHIKLATLDDVDRIIELRQLIKEFTLTPYARQMLKQAIETKTGRTYYIEDGGQIAACASTAAENSLSAMIVGVCTHPNYRNKGFASLILSQMIADITSKGKTLCLCYDNPAAGRIYKRLGFTDIGMWTMYR